MMMPLYDIDKSFAENVAQGPFFLGSIPSRPPILNAKKFLDFTVNSLIGVPACAITLSKGIALLATLGFDILTYKTIRAYKHPVYAFPNIKQIQNTSSENHMTIANSFGIGSEESNFLEQDIAKAKQSLHPGQILIVSIYGEGKTLAETITQFCHCALLAKEAGADVIEANLSCPNISGYLNIKNISAICSALKKILYTTPLIVKLGFFEDKKLLKNTLLALARTGVRGICGINSVKKAVLDQQGKALFGQERKYCGISGSAVKSRALRFTEWAYNINIQEKLDLNILSTGGVTQPKHFDEFFNEGSDVVLSATGTIWNPYLAYQYHQRCLERQESVRS